MIKPEILDALLAAGATADMIVAAVKADAVSDDARKARKRAMDAERQRRHRASNGESRVTERDDGDNSFPSSLPPTPPNLTTHTRECVSTPARENADFSAFWEEYPRKVGKGDARKAYAKAARKIGDDAKQVLTGALERAKAAWTDAQFIPHPATWLNRESWEDEPTVIQIQPRQAQDAGRPDPKRLAREANYASSLAGAEAASRLRRLV